MIIAAMATKSIVYAAAYALKAVFAGLLSTQVNVAEVGDTVYNATITAKGPVATTKQVVKPSSLVALDAPESDGVYFAKMATKKYQAAVAYHNDGTGRPQQTYAVAWDPAAKEALGLLNASMIGPHSDTLGAAVGGVGGLGLDIFATVLEQRRQRRLARNLPYFMTYAGADHLGTTKYVPFGYETELVVAASKKVVTGAIASVKGEDLVNAPNSDVSQALQGQTPGVQIAAYDDLYRAPAVTAPALGESKKKTALSVVAVALLGASLTTPGPIGPLAAQLAGAATPYNILDGWASFGQKGENFHSSFSMMWIKKEFKQEIEKTFPDSSAIDLSTKIVDVILDDEAAFEDWWDAFYEYNGVDPNGNSSGEALTMDDVVNYLKHGFDKDYTEYEDGRSWANPDYADGKGVYALDLALNTVADLAKQIPDPKKLIDNLGFGLASGKGYGKLAFDKKTQTANVASVAGQCSVVDFDPDYVPYEVWNIYTGKSLSNVSAGINDEVANYLKAKGGNTSEIFQLAYGLIDYILKPNQFSGYGTYSVKLNKSGGKAIAAAVDSDARIAAFLKAAKAPKFVTAEDVIDYRSNYLTYMFNGRKNLCAIVELPRFWFFDDDEYLYGKSLTVDDYVTVISPMTAANVRTETDRILTRFSDGNNYFAYQGLDPDENMPVVDFRLFGGYGLNGADLMTVGTTATGLEAAGGYAIADYRAIKYGDAVLSKNLRTSNVHDLVLATFEQSVIGISEKTLMRKFVEDMGYTVTDSFVLSGLDEIKAGLRKAIATADLRKAQELAQINAVGENGKAKYRYTSVAAYKLLLHAIEGIERVRDAKVKVLNADAKDAQALGIK